MESITLASGEWQDIAIPFTSREPVAADQAVVQFSPAFFKQSAEVRCIFLEKLPAGEPFERVGQSYAGQEPDAGWRAEATRRILENRAGPLVVNVVDALGKPVEGAGVEVEMTRHAYLFGTAAVASRLIDAPLSERREDFDQAAFLKDNERYRAELERLFNFVVFENDMKWSFWLNERKKSFDQSWTDDALNALRANGFKVKGHTMVWGSWNNVPTFLRPLETRPEALQNAILSHIRDLGDATRGRVEYFDVLNEPMSHYELIDLLGHDAVAEWFQTAHEALPDTRLIINDFDLIGNGGSPSRRVRFIDFVRDIRERGAPVDMVGFQSHFWSPRLTAPAEIWRILDQFHDELGLPVMVSEFDMNLHDEALQADYTRDFLTAWFAHPSTEAFIMWGFWGGAHWMRDAGAMYRRDWTEKPNLKAYTDLVFRDWWTEESLRSGEDGRVCVPHGFFGDYTIRVSSPDGNTTLERSWRHDGSRENLTVQLPPVL
jgi:GH35 family endo-1,4-beta-xylanase